MSDRAEFEKWILQEWGEPFHDFHGFHHDFDSSGDWSYSDHKLNAVWLGYRKGQAARAQGGEGVEQPLGAAHNGRVLLDRVENWYSFDCEAGPLSHCSDWQDLRRCFAALADHVERSHRPAQQGVPELEARIAELEQSLRRQASAAKVGMDAAKKSGAAMYQHGKKMLAESNQEVLDSERAMNAQLTGELDQARQIITDLLEYAECNDPGCPHIRRAKGFLSGDDH